ncbi:hypothetical protein BBK36DRAFT_1135445 [Trichoderma citrinoviride]|uniref:EH domain-containing protein n=1 Tax=Trichoderma citrinoviride TaxID=58853 RepID=A0A2T4BB26_9HYPO|nr:hypothetical protein BBK36DRAFT_1135445 [Trichoderma citrinoviride]PTB66524.1 hypothetical protein BBK36DRAFT_1135445 [Trichoderma citrinoviride]
MKSDSAATAAALRGATLAFRRDRVDVEQQRAEGAAGRRAMDNGAFTAATEAVRGRAERRAVTDGKMVQLQQQLQAMGGGMAGGGGATTSHLLSSAAAASSSGSGSGAGERMPAKKQSQSLIAATLAASRSASPTAGRAARADGLASSGGSANTSGGLDDVVDAGPLASTGSLISMFERARGRPSPPESVASSAEEKVDKTRTKATTTTTTTTTTKGRMPGKGEAPPTPPAARTTTRRDPVADAGPEDGSRAPAGDGRPKQRPNPATTAPAAEYSDISAYPMPSLTSHRQPPPFQQLHHQRPTSLKEHITAVSSPRLPSSPPRPMTPTSAPAVQPSTPASSSDPRPAAPRSSQTTTALHPSTPPPLKPLMSRHVAEVVSPQPRRVARSPLSPVTSPHLALSPGINAALAPPSPDPPKKSQDSATKRPPTPPKPRGSGKNSLDKDQGHDQDKSGLRGRSHSSNHTDGSSSGQTRSSGASAASRPAGQSTPPFYQHEEPRLSSMALARRHSTMSVPSLSPSRELISQRRLANGSPNRHTQLDNLTDAIVAGSLASTRLTPHNTGPSSLAPPPLPKRQKSPRLLQTLRQPHNLPEEEEDHHHHKKGHRALLRKGKHAHHEGSRKKWREEIRPRERKRYEALWASNRGILLTDTRVMSPATSISSDLDRDVSQCVANVVVREVWKRSRLPDDELAEIYDLVDRSRTGMLSRAEFVVGTWLVDQRLKGRKVPAKVTDSVWGSANGVRVKGPNGK